MSDDSLGFEPIDDELRRRLGAAGPRPGDPDATLGALRPRYRRAKRRHQLVLAGGTAVAVVAIIGLGTAVLGAGGSDPQHVRVPAADSSAPNGATSTTSTPGAVPTTPPADHDCTRSRRCRHGRDRHIGIGHRDVDGSGRAHDARLFVERRHRHGEARERRAVDRVDPGRGRVLGGAPRHRARSGRGPLHQRRAPSGGSASTS